MKTIYELNKVAKVRFLSRETPWVDRYVIFGMMVAAIAYVIASFIHG